MFFFIHLFNLLYLQTEEGREAEATHTPTMNTRSRGQRGTVSMYPRRSRRERPQPIVWQDGKNWSKMIN